MSFLELHNGCPLGGEAKGCFGPVGDYYTIFGSELRHLMPHAYLSILAGLSLLGIFYLLKRRRVLNLHALLLVSIAAAISMALFVLLAFLFQVHVVY